MFLKRANETEELISSLETNLLKLETDHIINYQRRHTAILKCLETAANIFDEVGLEKDAKILTNLMLKLADHDPATSGLTSEKMLRNLEQKGWVFNTDDSHPSSTNSFAKPLPVANDRTMAVDDDALEVENDPVQKEPEELLENLDNNATLGHP